MKRFFCSLLLCGAALLPARSWAQIVRPDLISTDDGATLVFNTLETFFVVDVAGDKVQPAPGADGFFQVDKRLVRIFNTPQKDLTRAAGQKLLMPKELLQLQWRHDLEEEQIKQQHPITNAKQEDLATPKGRAVLHWWFTPVAVPGGPLEKHYMSTVCDRQMLTVCVPVLPGDSAATIKQFMLTILSSLRESDDPIDVKEYAKELRGEVEK